MLGGQLLMQLRSFEVEHDHGQIGDPADRPYGNGVLLWFEVDDFDAAMERAAAGWGGRSKSLGVLDSGSGWVCGGGGEPVWDGGGQLAALMLLMAAGGIYRALGNHSDARRSPELCLGARCWWRCERD